MDRLDLSRLDLSIARKDPIQALENAGVEVSALPEQEVEAFRSLSPSELVTVLEIRSRLIDKGLVNERLKAGDGGTTGYVVF